MATDTEPAPLLLSTNQTCHRLGIGKTKLFELLKSGELESVTIGSARLVPADAAADYVDRLRHERPAVARLVEIIDEHGRLDVSAIPAGTTLADLESAKRHIAQRQVVA